MSSKTTTETLSPAELASQEALGAILNCLQEGRSFLLEAGAGAGKTYSLIETLKFLIDRDQRKLPRYHQRIACITFTNVAKDEIEARTDRNPIIYCDTIHAFAWLLISGFQKNLRDLLPVLPRWAELIQESGAIETKPVEYNTLGYRHIYEDRVTLHHDDVMLLTGKLLENPRFRQIMADRFPIILIDEYQDTNAELVTSIATNCLGQDGSPLFGLFGDHWQKIYGNGCGHVEHPSLTVIGKKANFRSVSTIVDCLNRMRPDLPQFVERPQETGSVSVFHSNNWRGQRRTGNHWQGDLPADEAQTYLQSTIATLESEGWEFEPERTKVLMLTHRGLASHQGYSSLPDTFQNNDSFTKKENPLISFFVDQLDPACDAFSQGKYGAMFSALNSSPVTISSHADKNKWFDLMTKLMSLREKGTVKEILTLLAQSDMTFLPSNVERLLQEMAEFDPSAGVEKPRKLAETESLLSVGYDEIRALRRYLEGHSPFETKHGVKGAEFENVLVVVGRGWNQYNFGEMLELANAPTSVPGNKLEAYERNRNLFYVACSRPKKRLAILFTQELSVKAMQTVERWFGAETIKAI